MADALLTVTDLVAGYRGPVVGPLSFSLYPGEVVGLTGGNGVGKSTVLRALTGQATRFEGAVRRRADSRYAYQDQQPPEIQELPLRAGELLALNAGSLPTTLPARLNALLDQRVDRLSGGQRQLLLVWAALLHPGEILLLDEPTNNLDTDGEALLVATLSELPAGRGALVISHEPDFLDRVADRVVEVGRA
ncbi:MAG: ATP-binding cassette domain-containing protein [Ectothiorhodospiraceae bacterium]|nr:ATP-binding cassette domain-containing protein [Ectothiorhodospiraceae bacterium]MCH8503896.1 ATP-binding cassette domain-containing protein [Ectothiorhodospiraceae bacterium]